MKPVLILQPIHNSSADIMKCFGYGKPLSADQLNFLHRYQKQLSSKEFDPIIKYYLQSIKTHKDKYHASFLLPHEILNFESIEKFKKRLSLFLRENAKQVFVRFTPQQFEALKTYQPHEVILWHGNQFLTGAPFFPGGIPPVIYFQWGNYFGVVKYVILPGEKALKANLLVYFEDMQERDLDQCVLDYTKKFDKELTLQKEVLFENKIEPERFDEFLIKTPTHSF